MLFLFITDLVDILASYGKAYLAALFLNLFTIVYFRIRLSVPNFEKLLLGF